MGSAKFTGPKTLDVSLNEGGTRVVRGEKDLYRNWHSGRDCRYPRAA